MKKLKLDQIIIDAGTQTRAKLNEDTIEDYAEAMTEGGKFPLIAVFTDGANYILADGFHRYMAAKKNGWVDIEVDLHKGTRIDALWYSLGANKANGQRMNHDDKRNSIMLALRDFPKKTQGEIAQHVGCSREWVNKVFGQVVNTSQPGRTVTGKDGKSYPARHKDDLSRPPKPPEEEKDDNGKVIPKKLLTLWHRAQEIQDILTQISKIRATIERAQEEKDALYAEITLSQVKAALDTAYTAIKATKPYCVCPTCQGEGCRACSHRGLIGKFRFDTVIPGELKK